MINNIKNKYTYETKTYNNYYFGKWMKNIELELPQPKILEEEMIKEILSKVEDKGFFNDILNWLRQMAPKKIDYFLNQMYFPIKSGLCFSYESMCKIVYQLGFRANEIIERRMILGDNNEWVQKYFKDFPIIR